MSVRCPFKNRQPSDPHPMGTPQKMFKASTDTMTLLDLPDVPLRRIIKYLNPYSLMEMKRACKTLFSFIDNMKPKTNIHRVSLKRVWNCLSSKEPHEAEVYIKMEIKKTPTSWYPKEIYFPDKIRSTEELKKLTVVELRWADYYKKESDSEDDEEEEKENSEKENKVDNDEKVSTMANVAKDDDDKNDSDNESCDAVDSDSEGSDHTAYSDSSFSNADSCEIPELRVDPFSVNQVTPFCKWFAMRFVHVDIDILEMNEMLLDEEKVSYLEGTVNKVRAKKIELNRSIHNQEHTELLLRFMRMFAPKTLNVQESNPKSSRHLKTPSFRNFVSTLNSYSYEEDDDDEYSEGSEDSGEDDESEDDVDDEDDSNHE